MKKQLFAGLLLAASATGVLNAQTYTMKVSFTNGESQQFDVSKVSEVTFGEKVSEPSYIEICGIKWASGNLQYSNGTWQIAPTQWDCFTYKGGKDLGNLNADYLFSSYYAWGTVGSRAVEGDECDVPAVNLDRMYSDMNCTTVTENFGNAVCGDIAYWATQGKWRMPDKAEFQKLVDEASCQYGYYTNSDGGKIYGILFTEPEGERVQNYTLKELTEEEIDNGLFLPYEGVGYYDYIMNAGNQGLYWTRTASESSENKRDAYCFTANNSSGNVCLTLRTNRCNIRPVLYVAPAPPAADEYLTVNTTNLEKMSPRKNVELSLDGDYVGTVIHLDGDKVYLRSGDKAIRLVNTGLENKEVGFEGEEDMTAGVICMGSLKGDFEITDGVMELHGNADTTESMSSLMCFGGRSELIPVEAAPDKVSQGLYNGDYIRMNEVQIQYNENNKPYVAIATTRIELADGFNLGIPLSDLVTDTNYMITGIVVSQNEDRMTIYLTETPQKQIALASSIAEFREVPSDMVTPLKLNDAVVLYYFDSFQNNRIYIRDATGALEIKQGDEGLQNSGIPGMVLNGTLTLKKEGASSGRVVDSHELSELSVTQGETPAPRILTIEELDSSADYDMVTVKGVIITSDGSGFYSIIDGNENTVYVSNDFGLNGNRFNEIEEGEKYDITGIFLSGNDYGLPVIKLTEWFSKSAE